MTRGDSLWQAMAGGPRRFLLSAWPWRSVGYLAGALGFGVVLLLALPIGLVFPPGLVLVGLPVGAVERRRLRWFDGTAVGLPEGARGPDSPHGVTPPGPGRWLRQRLGEVSTWREFGYTLSLASVLLTADLIVLTLLLIALALVAAPVVVAGGGVIEWEGLVVLDTVGEAVPATVVAIPLTLALVYAASAIAGAQAAFARWLLAPREAELNRKVEELAQSRTRIVDAFEAERRRIERDLHDGAQQHLVLLTMTLGLARHELGDDAGRAGELLREAHDQAREALSSIRELVRGIHPGVLTDLGLPAALGELAERCPAPVRLELELDRRLPAAVESTAYFVVAEALTNVVRHARAHQVTVAGRLTGDHLVLTVTDDGIGGADPGHGTGLRGLADRTAVLDGTLTVDSPPGGPTTLRMDLPCRCG